MNADQTAPDSYSVNEISECDEHGRTTRRRWGVVAEWTDEAGEIVDTDLLETFAREADAITMLAKLEGK